MKLLQAAIAGTLESSDAMVTVEPADSLEVEIDSSVYAQFGEQIRKTAYEVLKNLDVDGAKVQINDRGALDCTLRARLETAVFRANGQTENLPWRTKL
ncbi:citrate lyase acyl carrier protein [Amygdalobacter nucleatus]|uniref:Citrate lyase acyl carrier protein n=1 Tax=Amygdalobacter nucleatus TaxID=3029274 RepID=A0A133Y8N2_9FIRM|nr:citrate lyase acyl carrier protein [Amygdalobacter nucleatus]KXB39592.1 citrate lyase acyl carrier protein [Amygdalobacter nucleatus]MDF0486197.1 citrate lyase acyl carrier protein [Amygdalobacter nucleatus]WEG37244.1 citrate lyase acyl carrier protein [Amygdalobacter nucleatus]